jgi:hypothetical protein
MRFVYRSHYEGPLSRLVRELPDRTVLGWFQRGWNGGDVETWLDRELGVDVYGLSSIFEAAAELPVPRSWEELRDQLQDHLYVEGDESHIQMDEHSLRVLTDDDEVQLAYFFFDDHAIAASADRLAFLLHDAWPLPSEVASGGPFAPSVPVVPALASDRPGMTYAVLLTHYDGHSIATVRPRSFPGVRLPGLSAVLHATPSAVAEAWPPELQLLRALVEAGEASIEPALRRCNEWPGFNLNVDPWPPVGDVDDPLAARRSLLPSIADDRHPARSLLRVDDHLAQLAMHCNDFDGFQQWFLFDDVWAGSNPDLAQSLLRYASHWDPLSTETSFAEPGYEPS